jgi:hypothetical protein
MPWDVIDDLNAGGRPLVTTALWTEPREALAERENVVAIWSYEPYHGETVVDARDAVGKIGEYRGWVASCLALKPNTGYYYYPNAWAVECSTEEWDWEGPACERLTVGATEAHEITVEVYPYTHLGYWYALNVFTAAGFPQPWWSLAEAGQTAPKPHLPKAALWGEFQPVLNQAVLAVLRDWCNGSWSYGGISNLYRQYGHAGVRPPIYWAAWYGYQTADYALPTTPNGFLYRAEVPPGGTSGSNEPTWPTVLGQTVADGDVTWTTVDGTYTWAHFRSMCWGSVPVTDETINGAWGLIGKYGLGSHGTGTPPYLHVETQVGLTFDVALDLSVLWDVKHADESACDPTRVLIYWRHKCAAQGNPTIKDACNYEVHISGDGGANWTNLGAYTSPKDGTWHREKIELGAANYHALWTANFKLRFSLLDSKNADTTIWVDPGAGNSSTYDQTSTIDWLSVMVEFDWEYK